MSWVDPERASPEALRRRAGEFLGDIVDCLFSSEFFARIFEEQRSKTTKRILTDLMEFYIQSIDFWKAYNAKTEEISTKEGETDQVRYDRYMSHVTIMPGYGFWEWIICDWFVAAIRPLVKAMEDGIVGIAGQRSPVERPDQQLEDIPYEVLDNRLWRLLREKNQVEVLDNDGQVQATFRRCRLTVPTSPSPQLRSAQPLPTSVQVKSPQELEEEIKAIMVRDYDLERGSQALAKEFRASYPKYQLTRKRLEELFDKVRERRLPRGRPRVSRKD